MKQVCRVVFQDVKDCFLRVASNITKEGEYVSMMYSTASTAYFSVSSGNVSGSNNSYSYVGMNGLYAKQLGISEDEVVTLFFMKSLPKLQSVTCVHRSEDADALDLSKDILEDNILKQIKVVWPGQAFPIWMGKYFSFMMKIESLSPPCAVGMLSTGTELHLKPQEQSINKILKYNQGGRLESGIKLEGKEFRACRMPEKFPLDQDEMNAAILVSDWSTCWQNRPGRVVCSLSTAGGLCMEVNLTTFTCQSKTFPATSTRRNILLSKSVMTYLGLNENGYQVTVTPLDSVLEDDQMLLYVPEENYVEKNPVFSGPHLELIESAEASFELALHLTSSAVLFQPLDILHPSHNVAVLGDRGSGRSTLCKEICRRLEGFPHFVHTESISCRSLVGKRIDACGRILGAAIDKCFLCEPSILFLDDLDCLAPHVAPTEETSAEGIHNARMGELISEQLWEIGGSSGRDPGKVAALATAQSLGALSSSLVSPRGTHLLSTVLQIPSLRTDIREEMLLSLLGCTREGSEKSFNKTVHDIALRTAGFVAVDLVDLVERAVFDAFRRKACEKQSNLLHLTNEDLEDESPASEELGPHGVKVEDLESSLRRTLPLSLHSTDLVGYGIGSELEKVGKLWIDIGGLKEAKKKLEESVLWPLKHPKLFKNLPLKPRRGMLLYGPPGTGKTRLVSSLVGHCGLRLISVKGPELLSKYIGASEEAVRNVFKKAYSAQPCILFFDEFESLGPRRGHDSTGVTDRVVNQLLTQLDGVEESTGDGVFVVAATTRPDLIDPALLRPGRLDTPILCPMPDEEDRIAILYKLSRYLTLREVDLTVLGKLTEGFTGADLQAVLYSAQLLSLKSRISQDGSQDSKALIVEWAHIVEALDKTRPSLTKKEIEKYERSYNFNDGSTETMSFRNQKLSLA